jgi:hypothetical protein
MQGTVGRPKVCRLYPRFPIEDSIALADKDRIAEPQLTHRTGDFPNVRRVMLADFARRQMQVVESNANEFELRQSVIPRCTRCRQISRAAPSLRAGGGFSVATDSEETARRRGECECS